MNAASRLEAAWRRSDALFALVRPDALLDQPIRLRQPVLFYVGHLPAFAWNQLGAGVLGHGRFDEELDALFARGIDPEDEHDPGNSWPALERVLAYRDEVRGRLRERLGEIADGEGHDHLGPGAERLWMVLEHELMHHETLLYMLQQLPAGRLTGPWAAGRAGSSPVTAEWVEVPAGTVRLGAAPGEHAFGWDNEFDATTVEVPRFRIQSLPVRQRDLVEFVADGGYRRPDLWDEAGWRWRERSGLGRPLAWRGDAAGAPEAVALGGREVPFGDAQDWPASVSHAEATAYARWRGQRLPTEPELRRAGQGAPSGPAHANLAGGALGPEPVGSRPGGESDWGVRETAGNGWEWTSTPFVPLPGFRPHPAYPGYSADFFDGRHFVMLGGSWATDPLLVRPSFRNWFQPHYPYVFSKFRCVRDG